MLRSMSSPGVQGASKPVVSAGVLRSDRIREHLAAAESPPSCAWALFPTPIRRRSASSWHSPGHRRGVGRRRCPFNIVTTREPITPRDLDLLVAHWDRASRAGVPPSARPMTMFCARSTRAHHRGRSDSDVIDELHRAGVPVGLNLLPWIPDISTPKRSSLAFRATSRLSSRRSRWVSHPPVAVPGTHIHAGRGLASLYL